MAVIEIVANLKSLKVTKRKGGPKQALNIEKIYIARNLSATSCKTFRIFSPKPCCFWKSWKHKQRFQSLWGEDSITVCSNRVWTIFDNGSRLVVANRSSFDSERNDHKHRSRHINLKFLYIEVGMRGWGGDFELPCAPHVRDFRKLSATSKVA